MPTTASAPRPLATSFGYELEFNYPTLPSIPALTRADARFADLKERKALRSSVWSSLDKLPNALSGYNPGQFAYAVQTIGACAGLGRAALGNFTYHSEHCGFEMPSGVFYTEESLRESTNIIYDVLDIFAGLSFGCVTRDRTGHAGGHIHVGCGDVHTMANFEECLLWRELAFMYLVPRYRRHGYNLPMMFSTTKRLFDDNLECRDSGYRQQALAALPSLSENKVYGSYGLRTRPYLNWVVRYRRDPKFLATCVALGRASTMSALVKAREDLFSMFPVPGVDIKSILAEPPSLPPDPFSSAPTQPARPNWISGGRTGHTTELRLFAPNLLAEDTINWVLFLEHIYSECAENRDGPRLRQPNEELLSAKTPRSVVEALLSDFPNLPSNLHKWVLQLHEREIAT